MDEKSSLLLLMTRFIAIGLGMELRKEINPFADNESWIYSCCSSEEAEKKLLERQGRFSISKEMRRRFSLANQALLQDFSCKDNSDLICSGFFFQLS